MGLKIPWYRSLWVSSVSDVAVKVDGQWRLFDPGTEQVPYGSLLWYEEGQKALVCDSKEPFFLDVPPMLPERNLERRKADLKLSAEGDLEGTVRIELHGHRAVSHRIDLGDTKTDAREKELREELAKRIPGAELTALEVEALDDPEVPLVLKYRVRVPAYATRAGKRIVLSPSFFQRGVPTRFTASERRTPVWFRTGWLEEDEVRIDSALVGAAMFREQDGMNQFVAGTFGTRPTQAVVGSWADAEIIHKESA